MKQCGWRIGGPSAADLLQRGGRGNFPFCALVWGVGAAAGLWLAWKTWGEEERRKRRSKKEEPPDEPEVRVAEETG